MEAMRAGTHGRAFAVVAREMRSLTDRAAESTEAISTELDGTGEALRQAVAAAERGRSGMNVGLSEIEAGAQTLQRLSQLVSQSASGVGEIAGTVGQQDQGIGHVFGALTELTATLEQSEGNASRIHEAIALLENAATRVQDAAGKFHV
jgi:methyl-accepting chemotaxis protein